MSKQTSPVKVYLQPAFVISVVLLAAAAVATSRFGVIEKTPLPLKVPLDRLDEGGLGPYKVLAKPPIANEEIVESLGTKDYIQWILEDTEADEESVQRMLLFITYYGKPDRVPHVPEECYTGGGFQQLTSGPVSFEVRTNDIRRTIDGKCLVFGSKNPGLIDRQFPVLYFFSVNGTYAGNREDARLELNRSLFREYAYFSKVEIVFNQSPVGPDVELATAAAERLLSVVLPRLENRHWPDWENAVGEAE